MEMMGGPLSPSFQDSLNSIAELAADISKKAIEIGALKQEWQSKRQKKNPLVQSLLQSIATDALLPTHPPMQSVTTTTTTARSTASHQSSSAASSIPPPTNDGPPLPLRPSPTAMSTLTGDDNDNDNFNDDEAF